MQDDNSRNVQPQRYTSFKEGRGEFEDPSVVLQIDGIDEVEMIGDPLIRQSK